MKPQWIHGLPPHLDRYLSAVVQGWRERTIIEAAYNLPHRPKKKPRSLLQESEASSWLTR